MAGDSDEWPDGQHFRALALTGGGYRGLFSAQALASMEEATRKPIGQSFDLICGTSIGGIVAIAAAFEIPMSKVVEVFESQGPLIFPADRRTPQGALSKKIDLATHLGKPRYSSSPLRDAVEAIIPKGTRLAAYSSRSQLIRSRPQLFHTSSATSRHSLRISRALGALGSCRNQI